jgi:hypothetical protein
MPQIKDTITITWFTGGEIGVYIQDGNGKQRTLYWTGAPGNEQLVINDAFQHDHRHFKDHAIVLTDKDEGKGPGCVYIPTGSGWIKV